MVTDFFSKQEQAKSRTRLLLLYLLFSIAGIAFIVCFGVWLSLLYVRAPFANDPRIWFCITFGIALVVCAGSIYKILVLSAGGRVVAEELGGIRLLPDSHDVDEKRLLNVVEEMAIAAGIPVPDVYLLEDGSVNAFAAGHSPRHAVIGVTRGCLKHLNRDELQGVVGHEFSHILNGDMRLNIRLIGIIHGILMLAIVGRTLLKVSSNRNSKNTSIALDGLLLLVVGYIGVLFGNLIKAAVSRQREFLADASAVQFTRNPFGLSGALQKIGGLAKGSIIEHPKAEIASHMFFAQGLKFSFDSLFATHPPLRERIKQIDPDFSGNFSDVDINSSQVVESSANLYNANPAKTYLNDFLRDLSESRNSKIATTGEAISSSIGTLEAKHIIHAEQVVSSMPMIFSSCVREGLGAQAAVLIIFCNNEPVLREKQFAIIAKKVGQELNKAVATIEMSGEKIEDDTRLTIIELAMPALRNIPTQQYMIFRDCILKLVSADGIISISEYILTTLLFRSLDRVHVPDKFRIGVDKSNRGNKTIRHLSDAIEVIFSLLAHYGASNEAQAKEAFDNSLSSIASPRRLNIRSVEDCSVDLVNKAFVDCEASSPLTKKELIERATNCVLDDGFVTVNEVEILRAFCAVLDCPMPMICGTQQSGNSG